MGYYPPLIPSSWTPLKLTSNTFMRRTGKTYSNCPYIRAAEGVSISGGSLVSIDDTDVLLPGLNGVGTISSHSSGDYFEDATPLDNTISLSFLSNAWDNNGRMIDS